ncbi:MAG: aminopeptidase P family protein [Candidatus Krumholzibacteriota bacterium]|nr:aminopeptidase P family protein [Candidatus Krumholzibacteriota bacterium]
MKHSLARVQAALAAEGLAGWLLYDFRGSNPVALGLLSPKEKPHLTRRFLYWIPAAGEPVRLQSAVEPHHFADLPGGQRLYRSWRELEAVIQEQVPPGAPVAMEYSPGGAIPTIAWVDGGTLEWLRDLGVTPVSSADLVQRIEAPWSEDDLASHRRAGAVVEALRGEAMARLREDLAAGREATDMAVQSRLARDLAAAGLETDHPPVVAFGPDSGNPHHAPDPARPRRLAPGQVVLLDCWAREPEGVYADYTWMAFAGPALPPRETRVWEAVRGARDAAIAFLREAFARGEEPRGRDVDRAARDVVEAAGLGERFVHRLGHSLGREVHGPGVNLDDLETRDERRVIEGVAFSIEPGVYLSDFGMRSEVDALRWRGELLVSGELQALPELLA